MKLKKVLAPLMAVSLMVSAMPIANVSAASNDPRVYVNITYDDNGTARADIMFENIPAIANGGFHLDVGDGWDLKMDNTFNPPEIEFETKGCTAGKIHCTPLIVKDGDNDVFITFSTSKNYDLNGRFLSIYLEKNANFTPSNAKINVVFRSTEDASDSIATVKGDPVINSVTDRSPAMNQVCEYKIGDVNNDGYVDAIDSSLILSALEKNNNRSFSVESIKNNFKTIFPDAICPAAPDANQDDSIGLSDSNIIMKYYTHMSTNSEDTSRVGKIDFYEFFEDQ
ncbi:MAG: hypothetical protein NC205_01775 [Prevotella sp.]|nr:hypothetical protein [Alistipes senegalensis]MCM1357296.1 hypothetical protein [Prevotella sp.]MCM1473127.1 hypothetical protein [Muribaculaceae bacterium]